MIGMLPVRGRRAAVGLDHGRLDIVAGLRGWQWAAEFQAIPSVLLGILALWVLPRTATLMATWS